MRGVVLGGTRREGEGPEGEGGRQRGLKLITFPLHPRWSRGARPPPSPLTQRGEGPAVGVAALHAERVHQAVVALHGDAGQGEDLGHHGRALGERHHLADEGTCGRRQGTHQREKAGCVFVLSLRFKGCVYSHTAERHAQRYRRRLAPWGALSSQAVIRTEQGQGLGEGQQRWLALPAGEQAGGGGRPPAPHTTEAPSVLPSGALSVTTQDHPPQGRPHPVSLLFSSDLLPETPRSPKSSLTAFTFSVAEPRS